MTQDKEKAISLSIASGILGGLRDHKNSPEFADVTVIVGSSEFKCHRVILAACSVFFKALLSSGMKEDLQKRIELKEISTETFAEILDCLYTGTNILKEENMIEIWHAANQLQILFLLKECEQFLKEKISTSNCFAIYQSSKLLDSEELTELSWAYILQNFESIRRSDEILMLNENEMKSLISSQDLNTKSEDNVLDTILRWAAYKPSEYSAETSESSVMSSKQYQKQEEDEQKEQNERNDCASGDLQVCEHEKNMKLADRFDHLISLMEVSRICLLSGKYLLQLLKSDHVRDNKGAQEILEEALAYQLRPDRRHDFCPASAIHRSNNRVENVIVAANKYSNSYILVCRKQDGTWYSLGTPFSRGYISSNSAVSFNNNVYITTGNQQVYVYNTSLNQWRELPRLMFTDVPMFSLAVGNFLYVVHKESIEMINLENIYTSFEGQWILAGTLSGIDMNIFHATVVKDKILFLGTRTGLTGTEMRAVIFDLSTMTYHLLNDSLHNSSSAVSFSNGKENFILLNNGALYRVKESPLSPYIEIIYETLLWDFDRDLWGAVLFNEELLLFGSHFHDNYSDKQWELSLEGVFKCVKNIICTSNYTHFSHTTIQKAYLTSNI